MGRLLAVTSGKGGVGKSSVAAHLASALSGYNNSVLLIDLDAGMRCLDLMLGVSDRLVFDLNDILQNNISVEDAALKVNNNGRMFLIAAPLKQRVDEGELNKLINSIIDSYDFIILDFPAGGVNELYKALPGYAEALVVSNADCISVRDAGAVAGDLKELDLMSVRLVVNRVDFRHMKRGITDNIDNIIDLCSLRLIGVIPQSREIYCTGCTGTALNPKQHAAKAFDRIAKRILGYDIPLPEYKRI